jgi:hypothetical protein
MNNKRKMKKKKKDFAALQELSQSQQQGDT